MIGDPVVHAVWRGDALYLWGERPWLRERQTLPRDEAVPEHPFSMGSADLAAVLRMGEPVSTPIEALLPAAGGVPTASGTVERVDGCVMRPFRLHAVRVLPRELPALFEATGFVPGIASSIAANGHGGAGGHARPAPLASPGPSLIFFERAFALARALSASQRFVPSLRQDAEGNMHGLWQAWPSDEHSARYAAELVRVMPASARCAIDAFEHDPWTILDDYLSACVDALCRDALARDGIDEVIASARNPGDAPVRWLSGLASGADAVAGAPGEPRGEMARTLRRWLAGLEDRGASATWRLWLRLDEPSEADAPSDFAEPSSARAWTLRFGLASLDRPGVVVRADDVWQLPPDAATIEGLRLESPGGLLLTELARAARIFRGLDTALHSAEPTELKLSTREAYEFLREHRALLTEQGFTVEAPPWWDTPGVRIGARLEITSDAPEVAFAGPSQAGAASQARLGMGSLVNYSWRITLGDTLLTFQEFEQLASLKSPLVRVGGRWVEVRPEDIKRAVQFVSEHPGGKMSVLEAIRVAYADHEDENALPILGVEASGWVTAIFGGPDEARSIPEVPQPAGFVGTLRPYQVRGLRWLNFMESFGLGPCLADDMGLGKTVQILALLQLEKEARGDAQEQGTDGAKGAAPTGPTSVDALPTGPTLLVVPLSVLGNWRHEFRRFSPGLRVYVHHGADRPTGDEFARHAADCDAVITTYSLAYRDSELLSLVPWGRVVLDEAQCIKNPGSKQSRAVRSINAPRRVALTGTPVENRLAELWAIMDFLNPGFLGGSMAFRKRFAIPVERYRDAEKTRRLRGLIRPFILRRLKTDRDVISDLPEKIEMREYTHLTPEQAQLYEACVARMMGEIDRSDGMHRRGLVLAALVRLKQICNHPTQALKDTDPDGPTPPDPSRSGKCVRLLDLLEEIVDSGESALVFSQFKQMGRLLVPMIKERTGRDVLFLHGSTTQPQREAIVARFQQADGSAPVLVMSLKAGGLGLNLTAATHVVHFDRWWNPAVENQATDRAYRIGQSRRVEVHKFVASGTLEERIDEMLEKKTELAEQIIGAGEQWLTELDSGALRDLITLRRDTIGEQV